MADDLVPYSHGLAKRRRTISMRPHRKVRSGCTECKSRKVKARRISEHYLISITDANLRQCDEEKPKCSLCARYSTPCIYPTLSGHSAPLGYSPSVSPPLEIPRDLSDSTTDLQIGDLELLHHWTVYASHGFGDKPGDVKAWQIDMPQVACKQPFLMRGILAISALHMSRVIPEQKQKYLVRAVHHQNMSLPSYRYVIDDFRNKMTEENCHAVIGFASLTSAYAIAESHYLETNYFAGLSSPSGVPEWLQLLRGARQILDVGRDWISKGPMAFQIRSIEGEIDVSYNPEDIRLAALDTLFDQDGVSRSLSGREIEACRTTLRLLRQSAAIPFLPCQTLGIKQSMFRWVELVPQLYLQLLGDLKPQALILLAHYCILLRKGGDQYWYMEGAAERLLSSIRSILGEEWNPWIAWPLQMVNKL
jgi:hypothetical protein